MLNDLMNAKNNVQLVANDVFKPQMFRMNYEEDKASLLVLINNIGNIKIIDTIKYQLKELVKTLKPNVKLSEKDIETEIEKHLGDRSIDNYGVWVYYPWKETLVHLLDEKEFILLRTNRNKYKITEQEQEFLSTKKIGVIGLSVGQSIAVTMAMERVCGHLVLADYDTIDLSNLNRLRTSVTNIGLKKTVIAAREILEMDPFLDIEVYNEGVTNENIDVFFTKGGKLDLLVEVCDGLDMKIIARYKARELGIPVVMDTNDRGMIDVERFDTEPERAILHGLADGLEPKNIKDLTNEDKVPYILKMIGVDTISTRLKASMLEVEQSISTWPQLASSVTLGGALTTDVCRRILLAQFHESGRFYVDFEELVRDKQSYSKSKFEYGTPPTELTYDDLKMIADRHEGNNSSEKISEEKLSQVIESARLAPSGGNAQPWKLLLHNNKIFIFHDAYYSYSLLDVNNIGSYISLGTMLENIDITSSSLGLSVIFEKFPLSDNKQLVAMASFTNSSSDNRFNYLMEAIPKRVTNRTIGNKAEISEVDKLALISIASSVSGAKLHWFDSQEHILEFAELLTSCEMLRLLHPQGHFDTFVNELRFTQEQIENTSDGLDIHTLNMSEADKAALQIAKDPIAISFLHKLEKGSGFKKISRNSVLSASSIGVISMDGHDATHYLDGGQALQRIWLEATYRGIAFQPITQITFMLERYHLRGLLDFNPYELEQLEIINKKFVNIIQLKGNDYPIFVFRMFYGDKPKIKALRRAKEKVVFSY